MENEADKKNRFTWVIKNFSSLQSGKFYSDQFVVGGCKWRLFTYPKGYKDNNSLSLFLEVADHGSLPSGWRRHARYSLSIVNQFSGESYYPEELQHWFDEKSFSWGFESMLLLNALQVGYLVKGELKLVAEIDLLDVIGMVDVNGFQLLPSQVEFVSRMFKKHPEIASEFRPKNPILRTGYMSMLLSLIETLQLSPQELPKADLDEAYAALGSMTDAGFKLDWLENKLDEMWEKKEQEEAGVTRMQEIEEDLKDLKQKCLDLEAQLEKEKAKVLAAKAPISFDDVI